MTQPPRPPYADRPYPPQSRPPVPPRGRDTTVIVMIFAVLAAVVLMLFLITMAIFVQ